MNDKIIQLIKKNVQIQFILLYLQNKAVGLIFTFVEHSLFLIIMAAQKIELTNAYRRELREKILATAIESFQENGIKAVKMDDIANRLSISKRTLYEIYGNKEDLLYECVCYHDKHFEKELQSRLSPKSSVMDILICFMRLHIEENSRTNPQFYSELHKYPKVMDYINERNEKTRDRSMGFMQRGVEEGYFRKDVNYEIVNLMAEVFMKYVMDHELYKRFPMSELMRNVILLMLRGFCTEKGRKLIDQSDF